MYGRISAVDTAVCKISVVVVETTKTLTDTFAFTDMLVCNCQLGRAKFW